MQSIGTGIGRFDASSRYHGVGGADVFGCQTDRDDWTFTSLPVVGEFVCYGDREEFFAKSVQRMTDFTERIRHAEIERRKLHRTRYTWNVTLTVHHLPVLSRADTHVAPEELGEVAKILDADGNCYLGDTKICGIK